MKKKIMNIRPQEVTENGERSVQYKGSDGRMHNVAPGNGGGENITELLTPLILRCEYNVNAGQIVFTDGNTFTIPEIIEMLDQGKKVFLSYHNNVMTGVSYDKEKGIILFSDFALAGQNQEQCQQRVITWNSDGLGIRTKVI